jgi:hypothetical protein
MIPSLHIFRLELFLILVLTGLSARTGNLPDSPAYGDSRYTLYPPHDLSVTAIECSGYLAWHRPEMPNGTTPPGILGYFVYRNGESIAYVPAPDTVYFDEYPDPGTYTWCITANYDLGYYGFPGQTEESMCSVPNTFTIGCDFPFPFFEPWNSANFNFNAWTFPTGQGNWNIETTSGNPPPTAKFSGQPIVYNYSYLLQSFYMNGVPFSCSEFHIEFDYKLENITSTGNEKMILDVRTDTTWYEKIVLSNTSSTGWTHVDYQTTEVAGKGFRFRFRAEGQNSACINAWYVDNIFCYAICNPPRNFALTGHDNIVNLTWSPPECPPTGSGQGSYLTGYNIYRAESPGTGTYEKLTASLVSDTTYTDLLPVIPPPHYCYVVTALYNDSATQMLLCETPSPDTLCTDQVMGLPAEPVGSIAVFPNPATDLVVIRADEKIEDIQIRNIAGMEVFSLPGNKTSTQEVIVSGFPAGLYFIRIKTEKNELNRKVFIVH